MLQLKKSLHMCSIAIPCTEIWTRKFQKEEKRKMAKSKASPVTTVLHSWHPNQFTCSTTSSSPPSSFSFSMPCDANYNCPKMKAWLLYLANVDGDGYQLDIFFQCYCHTGRDHIQLQSTIIVRWHITNCTTIIVHTSQILLRHHMWPHGLCSPESWTSCRSKEWAAFF